MKKLYIAWAIALTGILLFSCTKEIDRTAAVPENTVTISATASIEGQATKTDYTDNGTSGIAVDWSTEDSFKAYYSTDGTYSSSDYQMFSTTDGSSFTGAFPSGVKSFRAVYGPVTYDGSDYTVSCPGYAQNTGAIKNIDAMIAGEAAVSGDNVAFSFSHKCAILKLTLNRGSLTTDDAEKEKTVSLTFLNCKYSDDTVTWEDGVTDGNGWTYDAETKSLRVDVKLSAAIPAEGSQTIYVAIPPVTYLEGTTPTSSTASYTKTFSLTSGNSLSAGQVYGTSLTFAPDGLKASFGTPGGNGKYPIYTWTGSTSNLMTAFEFGSGELANYTKLTFTFGDLVDGPVRMGYYVGSSFTEFNSGYYNAGTKTVDLTGLSVDLSTVTKIAFGGRSSAGSCTIWEREVVLSGEGVPDLTASFGTPASNATYPGYSWTSGSNNLMNCFTFTGGELAYYKTLNFKFTEITSGKAVRINVLFDDSTNYSKNFYTEGVKSVSIGDLLDGHTASQVTAIRFGGANVSESAGSCFVKESDMYLSK